jgi:DNA helicase-2/ATP-dependent DNA helicase PcrA
MFIDLTVKFERYYSVSVLSEKRIDKILKDYFSVFLHYLYKGGISEYEDGEVLAPSGAISFMTIHQSKGMEFPITIVTGLHNKPKNQHTELDSKLFPFMQKEEFEPYEMIADFDYTRLYYTAFSRAQNLLVLSDMIRPNSSWVIPSKAIENTVSILPKWDKEKFKEINIELAPVKKAEISHQYSFTSDIALFENCPLQYKFYRELEFSPARSGTIIFGTLVHQTIEDIHTDVFKNDFKPIPEWRIEEWLYSNYNLLALKENAYLDERVLKGALKHVLTYYRRNQTKLKDIVAAEVDVSVLRKNYILKGVIDLIQGEGDTVEIVDFKATKKPKDFKKGRLDLYQRQLEVYAHIVEEKYGKTVSRMHLYYTGETEGDPKISYIKNSSSINKTLESFDRVVEKIENRDYDLEVRPIHMCKDCDFRHYCAKVKPEEKCKSRLF